MTETQYIGTSHASLDGEATTIIVVNEEDRKKYGLREQGAVGSITTAKFRTLKGAHAFQRDCLFTIDGRLRYSIVGRERNLESKAKRPVYDYIVKYDYRDYERVLEHKAKYTPLTELNEFFPPS